MNWKIGESHFGQRGHCANGSTVYVACLTDNAGLGT